MALNFTCTYTILQLQCDSRNSTQVNIIDQSPGYSYSVKVVNRAKKSVYAMKKLRINRRFKSVDDLKRQLTDSLGQSISCDAVGYIEPGHGPKGKQRWLDSREDLDEMYQIYEPYHGKREILIWCYESSSNTVGGDKRGKTRKRSYSPVGDTCAKFTKRHDACVQKLSEVEEIVTELKEKHESEYSIEKLNAWAHLIHLGKHASYETPPDLPYFKKREGRVYQNKANTIEKEQPTPTVAMLGSGASNSPAKRLGFRTENIDQLSKWHNLLEKGGITQQEYDELKKTILQDIIKLA